MSGDFCTFYCATHVWLLRWHAVVVSSTPFVIGEMYNMLSLCHTKSLIYFLCGSLRFNEGPIACVEVCREFSSSK